MASFSKGDTVRHKATGRKGVYIYTDHGTKGIKAVVDFGDEETQILDPDSLELATSEGSDVLVRLVALEQRLAAVEKELKEVKDSVKLSNLKG